MEQKIVVQEQEGDEISIKELILKLLGWCRYILSKWIIILGFGIIGGVLGYVYAWSKKPIYTASTTFVLEGGESGGGLGQYSGLASMVGLDMGGGGGGIFQGDNILELYKSRTMIEKTLLSEIEHNGNRELLVNRYIDFNKLRDKWKKIPGLSEIAFKPVFNHSDLVNRKMSRLQDSILGTIVFDINKDYLNVVKPDKKLNIIQASVQSADEVFSKAFDEEIVKNVNDFYLQTKTRKSHENIAIMQRKTDSVRAVMNGAIYHAAEITDATPNLNLTRQVQRTAPIQRSQLSAETNKAVLQELIKSLELSKISLLKETPLIQVIDKPVFPLDKERTSKLKWLIIGGFLASFFTGIILVLVRIIKNTMA